MSRLPSPRQLEVVSAIRNYRHIHGIAPTIQELADTLGLSKVTIFEHLGNLEKMRVIRRERHSARSVEVIADSVLPDDSHPATLPVLGNISAGHPVECVESRQSLDLATMFNARKGVYAVRVRDDSMTGDNLCEGDCLIIDRRDNARNGDTVLAMVGSGETVLGRFYHDGENIRLQPLNASGCGRLFRTYHCRVQGIVMGMLRADAGRHR